MESHSAEEDRAAFAERVYADSAALMDALAEHVIAALAEALASRGTASLVVAGGRTPIPLFERLSRATLDWARVQITLTDERVVPVSDPASNERLVREHLLRGEAAAACFIGLMHEAVDDRARATAAWRALAAVPRPFDVVVPGMGEDGHFASLFPGAPALAAALDVHAAPACVAMPAPVAPHARLSLNLAALLDARLVLLPIIGATKARVFRRASAPGAVDAPPIAALLGQRTVRVVVYRSDV
jgi:6-phosphogluconolactonase